MKLHSHNLESHASPRRRTGPLVLIAVLAVLSSLLAAPAAAVAQAEAVIDAVVGDRPDDANAAAFTCKGLTATIVGTNGRDTLNGTPKRDVIVGRGGNDTINGGGGNDVICAGSGNDTVIGGAGADYISLGAGNDIGQGNGGNDTILGGKGNDKLHGQTGKDTIRAGKGNDTIEGGSGHDALHGGVGTDLIKGGSGIDMMYGGKGTDLLDGMADGGEAYGGPGSDACYNATQPKQSGCDKDQLWTDRASGVETSDLTQIASDAGGGASTHWASSVQIDGKTYRRGLGCDDLDYADSDEFCEWEYNLGRGYKRFAAYVGTDDRSESTAIRVLVEVIGDDDVIVSSVITFGQRQRIVANVSNVLRLRLRMTALNSVGFTDTMHFFTDPRISRHPGLYPADPIG